MKEHVKDIYEAGKTLFKLRKTHTNGCLQQLAYRDGKRSGTVGARRRKMMNVKKPILCPFSFFPELQQMLVFLAESRKRQQEREEK